MSQAPVVVLGAGVAGLSAAWRLRKRGRPVLVVEAADHVGGLAGGVRMGGNVYEYGPHVFHTTDPEILADIKQLMGPELLPYHRTIQIKFLGNYFQFPLSVKDALFKLPPTTVLAAAATFAYRFLEGFVRRPKVETSETVLLRYYGDVLYKIFFKDYIERVWGVPPSTFSPAFARERIPRLNILELIESVSSVLRRRVAPVTTTGYVEKVSGDLYTTRRGFSLICERMAARLAAEGCELHLNTRVLRMSRSDQRIVSVRVRQADGEKELPCSGVVSTLPINEAVKMIEPGLDANALSAADGLRFRAITFVGLKVRRPKVLPASFMYFREHSFNRITDLAHFSFKIDPEGRTLLVAEIMCDPGDAYWTSDAKSIEAVTADLVREKFLARDEIEESVVFRAEHAHPIYALGYEKALETVLGAFGRLENLETAGRQGRFAYVNTHIAMKMGLEAADRLHGRLARA